MFCLKCGAQIPEASAFCNKCGASQAQPSAAAPASPGAKPPSTPTASGKDQPEEMVWKGRYSGKSAAHWWLLWFLWIIAVAYSYLAFTERGAIVSYIALAAIALPALAILWSVAVRKLTIRYRLTTHRFFRERGLISRHIDELELIRVDDVSVRQNIIQRIFNVGVVTIISTDATDPRLEVEGIDDPIDVKEKIRHCARERRSRALYMESL